MRSCLIGITISLFEMAREALDEALAHAHATVGGGVEAVGADTRPFLACGVGAVPRPSASSEAVGADSRPRFGDTQAVGQSEDGERQGSAGSSA